MVALSEGKVVSDGSDEVRIFDHPALIVWNMQNGIVSHINSRETILPTIRDMIDTAHKTDVPVVFSQHHNFPVKWMDPGMRDLLHDSGVDTQKGWMRLGSTEWEIVPLLKPSETDLILPVHTPSFFQGTPLEHVLHNYDIHTIILVGTASHSGILLTARQAMMLGFAVVLVEDGIGGITPEEHQRAMRLLAQGCEVMSATEVIERFNRNATVSTIPTPLLGFRAKGASRSSEEARHSRSR
jgi:nicotinamidase-related amidase